MTSCIFSAETSTLFAEASGDCNPLHINSGAARRSYFGDTVVHGIHILLYGADLIGAALGSSFVPKRIRASFNKPLPTGASITYTWDVDQRRGFVKLIGQSNGSHVVRAVFHIESANQDHDWSDIIISSNFDDYVDFWKDDGYCQPLEFDEHSLGGVSGLAVLRSASDERLQRLFPKLSELWPRELLAGMLLTTNIIGMHVPGLFSIFSNLDISWGERSADNWPINAAAYKVLNVHTAVRRCQIATVGKDWRATLTAFVRPSPVNQSHYSKITPRLSCKQFIGQRALVIGGSRGLGEVTAKILAAGGAQVVLTYANSQIDAQTIVEEIIDGGGKAVAQKFDIREEIGENAQHFFSKIQATHLYYFATPPLIGNKFVFSPKTFDKYVLFYLTAFEGLVKGLVCSTTNFRHIFWPSSTAISELPSGMVEYAMAKAAGEILCTSIKRAYPNITLHTPRLPRVRTDLTANPLIVDGADAVDVLMPLLIDLYSVTKINEKLA